MQSLKIIKLIISLGLASTLGLGTICEPFKTSENINKRPEIVEANKGEVKTGECPLKVEEQKQKVQANASNDANKNTELNIYENTEKQVVASQKEVKTDSKENISNENKQYNETLEVNEDNNNNLEVGQNSTVEDQKIETPNINQDDSYIAEIEQMIFEQVNQQRQAAGLQPLSYNGTMEHYARAKSKDMGVRGYFDHKNPEGQLMTEQMRADGISYNAWGENIAYISGISGNSNLANQFMTNWMNSSGHRANILSNNFTSIGVGVYKIGNTYYATQEFYR